MVVIGLLGGLHGLSDLHPDDVDFGFAVLQHLLSRLEELLVLQNTQQQSSSVGIGSWIGMFGAVGKKKISTFCHTSN